MTTAQIGILIAMVVYLVSMMLIGVKVSKRNKTAGDFYLGGRKLGPLVTAMSAEASDMSSYLLMGLPGLAYLSGLADVGWTAIGLAAGTYLNWLIVAKKLRRYTEKLGAITVPEFFSKRYKDEKNLLTLAGALIIIVFFVPYTASGFAACGKLFSSLFGANYYVAMIISAAVIIFYTSMGGFLAASLTDLIQSIIMTAALIIVLLFALNQAGGAQAALAHVRSLPGYLSFTQTYDPVSGTAQPYSLLTIISTLAWGLGYFGMPHILLRFMAIEDEKKLSISRRVASIWVLIAMGIAVMIGVAGLGMTKEGLIEPLSGSASETVIVEISSILAEHGILAALVAGIVLSGILASTMSTSDSQLLAASSSVSNDILMRFFHKDMSEKKTLLVSRVTLLVIALIGILLAWDPNSSVFGIVSFAWAGFGASFGPVVLLALYWKRSNKAGALAGIFSGGLMVFVWKFAVRPLGGIWDLYELLPAFLTALVVNVIVSLLTKAPDQEVLDTFEQVKAE
ncbi:MAG: sodium/proline symporter [Lachnospiraceae bacterium]|jgi:sodium/proline symporter